MTTGILRAAAVGAGAFMFAGCATLLSGTRDTINFNTTPDGALVRIDGIDVGRTPVVVRVKRSVGDRVVTLRLDGYADRSFVLGKEFNLVSVLNLSNVVGWGIDVASGALFKYSENAYHMELERRVGLAKQLGVEAVYLLHEVGRDSAGAFVTPALSSVAVVDPAGRTVLVLKEASPNSNHS